MAGRNTEQRPHPTEVSGSIGIGQQQIPQNEPLNQRRHGGADLLGDGRGLTAGSLPLVMGGLLAAVLLTDLVSAVRQTRVTRGREGVMI
jgi:hypothetical protein